MRPDTENQSKRLLVSKDLSMSILTLSLLWHSLHIFVTLIEAIMRLLNSLQAILMSFINFCHENAILSHCDKKFLDVFQTDITKCPRHVMLVVSPNEKWVDENTLSKLFLYALKVGVKTVSFVDTRQENEGKVIICNVRPPNGVNVKILGDNHGIWSINSANAEGITKADLNFELNWEETQLEVHNIGLSDGRQLISDVCRNLFIKSKKTSENIFETRLNLSEHINDELTKSFWAINDPDLALIFCNYTCTFGILPWQTRFTEFYTHRNGNCYCAKDFMKALRCFAKCEQRFGK